MPHLRKLPPWIAAGAGLLLFLTIPTNVLAVSSPASFYDWGPYYKPKVLGFSAYAQEPLPPVDLPPGVAIPTPTYLLPDNPFYFTKTLFENTQTFFTFNATAKQERYLDLAQERLAESYALTTKGKVDLAQETADRYQEQIQAVNDNLIELDNKGTNINNLSDKAERQAVQFPLVAQNALSSAQPATADLYRTVLQGSQDLADITAQVQGDPVIPPDLSASLQSLKSQGLLTVEESNKIYSFSDRSQVRDEIEKLTEEGIFPKAEMTALDDALKQSYPDEYKKTYETAKFEEIRNFESYPKPDENTLKKLTEFKNSYKEGEPIPSDLKPHLYYLRQENLAQTINFDLLPKEAQQEVRNFYPHDTSLNPTADNPTPPTSETPAQTPPNQPAPEQTPPNIQPTKGPDESTPQATTPPSSLAQETFATPSADTYIGHYEGLLPDSPFYFLKTLQEKAALYTTFGQEDRLKLTLQYNQERLREANELLQNGHEDQGLAYLNKYTHDLASITDKITKLDENNRDVKVLAARLDEEVARQNIIFEKAIIPTPTSGSDELQKAIVATQNALDVAADVENKAALPTQLVDRLQDLKNLGQLLPEEVDKITKLDSRVAVREEFRKLEEKGMLPPADSKKLDDSQLDLYPEEFNKLI